MKKPVLALLIIVAAIGISILITTINYSNAPIEQNTNTTDTLGGKTNDSQGQGNTQTGITLQELQTHNSRQDCWVVYKNKVYDVTSFLPKHPGSAGAITPYCGNTGFEAAFIQQHGTSKASLFLQVAKFMGDFNEKGALA